MTTALFIHHSVGQQIIHEGGLREKLSSGIPALELWDHNYNAVGLSDGSGAPLGVSFPIPDDNTDPDGLLAILRGIEQGETWADRAKGFDVLMLKSCFPNNMIDSDATAASLKGIYQNLREVAMALPHTVLLMSSPPLVFESTRPAQVARATHIAAWLGRTWTGPGLGYANIFNTLTYHSGPARGTLRLGYRRKRPGNSHVSVAGAQAASLTIVSALRAVL